MNTNTGAPNSSCLWPKTCAYLQSMGEHNAPHCFLHVTHRISVTDVQHSIPGCVGHSLHLGGGIDGCVRMYIEKAISHGKKVITKLYTPHHHPCLIRSQPDIARVFFNMLAATGASGYQGQRGEQLWASSKAIYFEPHHDRKNTNISNSRADSLAGGANSVNIFSTLRKIVIDPPYCQSSIISANHTTTQETQRQKANLPLLAFSKVRLCIAALHLNQRRVS